VTGNLALCDICAKRWNRLDTLIRNVQTMTENSVRFRIYGILMFFVFIWVPGLRAVRLHAPRMAFYVAACPPYCRSDGSLDDRRPHCHDHLTGIFLALS
jgi:hypothetical protein